MEEMVVYCQRPLETWPVQRYAVVAPVDSEARDVFAARGLPWVGIMAFHNNEWWVAVNANGVRHEPTLWLIEVTYDLAERTFKTESLLCGAGLS